MSAGRKGRRKAVVNGDLRMNKEQHKVTVQSLREGRPGSRQGRHGAEEGSSKYPCAPAA